MTPENFVYWLQGMLELGKATELNTEQVQMIKDRVALVLAKKTPNTTTLTFPLTGTGTTITC